MLCDIEKPTTEWESFHPRAIQVQNFRDLAPVIQRFEQVLQDGVGDCSTWTQGGKRKGLIAVCPALMAWINANTGAKKAKYPEQFHGYQGAFTIK